MVRYGTAERQAKHTGKSGFVSTQPRGGTPFPYSFLEEASSNLYPQVRDYIPKDFRTYSDSYYDLRNEKYQFWYDKWGKPHINKWWQGTLDETLRIQKAYKTFTSKSSNYNARSIKYGSNYNTRPSGDILRTSAFIAGWRECKRQHRSIRPGPNRKRWKQYYR